MKKLLILSSILFVPFANAFTAEDAKLKLANYAHATKVFVKKHKEKVAAGVAALALGAGTAVAYKYGYLNSSIEALGNGFSIVKDNAKKVAKKASFWKKNSSSEEVAQEQSFRTLIDDIQEMPEHEVVANAVNEIEEELNEEAPASRGFSLKFW